MGYLPRDNLSSLQSTKLRLTFFQRKLSARNWTFLKAISAKACKLLSSFLKQREKARNEEEYLHKLMAKERLCMRQGYELIAGVDEPEGALAGPVVARR